MTNFRKVLSGIRHFSPLLQMTEMGVSPAEMKEMVVSLFEPYFSNQDILRRFAVPLLVPEAVNLIRLRADSWALEMYHHCLRVHHSALAVAGDESLRACATWESAIQHAVSEFWSVFHLEIPKTGLPLEEFKLEIFRNIGALVEACVQPYLRELLHQARLKDRVPNPDDSLGSMTLGNIVAELMDNSGFTDCFAIPPHGVRLNQWRNIAQHHSSRVEGEQIVCWYGREPNIREFRLTRDELFTVTWHLFNIFIALKLARTVFFMDNVEVAQTFLADFSTRSEAIVLSFASAVATQGFEVLNVQLTDEEASVVVRDVTDMDPDQRRFHASQFVYALWNYIERPHLKIEYREKDGVPNLLTIARAEDCERVANGEIEFYELASLTEMVDLKANARIPRREELDSS